MRGAEANARAEANAKAMAEANAKYNKTMRPLPGEQIDVSGGKNPSSPLSLSRLSQLFKNLGRFLPGLGGLGLLGQGIDYAREPSEQEQYILQQRIRDMNRS